MPSAGACACPPPPSTRTTHLCLGTEDGKIWILDAGTYLAAETKPLAGHVGPVEAVICHPSGAAALSAARGRGRRDGTVRLWDLTRGKAAHVHRITGTKADASDVRWSPDGKRWGYCAGSLVRAFDAEKGDVPTLDVDLGTKVNALCFVQGGSILAAGCEDGSLAVLAVGDVEEGEEGVVRGVMALYPKVETGKTAGNDRIKKVLPATFSERERRIVTVTSSGRVTVWDLTRPINRVLGLDGDAKEERGRDDGDANNSEEEDDEEEDLAVLIQEVLVGSDGTRVTDMVVWGRDDVNEEDPPPTNAGNPADAKAAAPNEHERDSKKESTNVDSCDGVSETERDIAPMAAPLASAVQVKEEKEGGWKTRGPYDSNKKPQEDGRVLADDLDDLKKEGAPLLLQKKKQKEKKGKKKKKGKDGSGKVKSV
uniref:Uncharacterized protein n=2 Tax=Corethron hystrix TaxID=216773 RepID=A0A7S1FZ38_9STRA